MIRLTKIFHFEMAHAINNFPGICRYIHGHSYKLHVTVSSKHDIEKYIESPGYIIDFKDLKDVVFNEVILQLDHKLLLSEDYIKNNPGLAMHGNLVKWEAEPTVENLLVFVRKKLKDSLPSHITLTGLKIFETADSFAEWSV